GIRGSLNTIRVTLQNITTKRDQYQNILNDTNNRERNLRNQLRDNTLNDENRQVEDLRNQLRDARNQYTNAYWGLRNNWQLAQNRQERIGELLRENFVFRLLIQRKDTQIAEHRRTAHRLTGQILALQNNPLLNMANAHLRRLKLLKILNPNLGKFQSYTGQEPPDEYLDKVIQSWAHLEGHMTLLENANAGDFDNAYKCEILKSMMGGKYTLVPANNGLIAGNPAINTPDTLRAWMRAKYTWMRIANPAGIDAFFTELKNLWLEHPPNLNRIQTSQNNSSAEIKKLNSQIASLQAQLAQPAQVYPQNNEVSANFEKLNSKIAFLEAQLAESMQHQRSESLPFGGLEKRLGKIEALLAKLAKDSKSRSGRVHMATVDDQSDPIFSDDDTSKPEDNDYNSDNSSAGSDSRNRDMNIYISHGNEKKNKDSHGKRVSLEETIRKIIQIEFENYLLYIIQQAKKCVPALAQDSDEEDVLDGSMEIDFVKKKEPTTSIASIKCKIKRLKIPAMALDSCAELPIITPDIVECVGYGIDKSIKHDLSDELKISHNSKDLITIPVTMHKVKNKLEVNCATTTSECNESSTPDCILQDLSEDEINEYCEKLQTCYDGLLRE
ncbi:hypothetical protein RhiirC2_797132, partial [Rhizophagus irregularis]